MSLGCSRYVPYATRDGQRLRQTELVRAIRGTKIKLVAENFPNLNQPQTCLQMLASLALNCAKVLNTQQANNATYVFKLGDDYGKTHVLVPEPKSHVTEVRLHVFVAWRSIIGSGLNSARAWIGFRMLYNNRQRRIRVRLKPL